MAAHLTLFCKSPPAELKVADVHRALEAVEDWYSHAECFGIEDEDLVREAERALTLEDGGDEVAIRYREPNIRPIVVRLVTAQADVRTWCEEVSERVDPDYEEGAAIVLAHLGVATGVVDIELGWPELERMGVVIANAVAEHLALAHEGLIQDQNDDWFAVDEDRVVKVLVGPPVR